MSHSEDLTHWDIVILKNYLLFIWTSNFTGGLVFYQATLFLRPPTTLKPYFYIWREGLSIFKCVNSKEMLAFFLLKLTDRVSDEGQRQGSLDKMETWNIFSVFYPQNTKRTWDWICYHLFIYSHFFPFNTKVMQSWHRKPGIHRILTIGRCCARKWGYMRNGALSTLKSTCTHSGTEWMVFKLGILWALIQPGWVREASLEEAALELDL